MLSGSHPPPCRTLAAPARSGSQTPTPQGQPPQVARNHAQSIPNKAPKAPGWVSGVDGASTLVSSPQLGEGDLPI
jgi:hypothetical protein